MTLSKILLKTIRREMGLLLFLSNFEPDLWIWLVSPLAFLNFSENTLSERNKQFSEMWCNYWRNNFHQDVD